MEHKTELGLWKEKLDIMFKINIFSDQFLVTAAHCLHANR
jgi:hypothetical protein